MTAGNRAESSETFRKKPDLLPREKRGFDDTADVHRRRATSAIFVINVRIVRASR